MKMYRVLLTVTLGLLLSTTAMAQPLAGTYDIGGGANNFSTIIEAVDALELAGISDAVTFNVYGADYPGQVRVDGPIAGASAEDTILFQDASGTARITLAEHFTGTSEAALTMDSASHFIFDGIDILLNHPNDSAYKTLSLMDGASYNIFRNATYTGAGFVSSSIKYGIFISTNECNYNLFDNLHLTHHNHGVRITGFTATGMQHTGNVFHNLQIDDVWTGFYVSNTDQTHIRGCDIQVNGPGNTSSAWGIYIDDHQSGDSVFVYDNVVHNLVSGSGSGSGMARLSPASGVAMVYNNVCYGFNLTGTGQARGIYTETGQIHIYFNSILLNDLASSGNAYTVYVGSSSGVEYISNNIFYNGDLTGTAVNVYGTLATYTPNVLNYNAYYGAGTNYVLARWSSTNYANLAALQAGTAFEDNGVEGDPGFVGPTDLHISPTQGLVNAAGTPIAGITTDFDGETRGATPDIGADEYEYAAPNADFAVLELLNIQALYPELTPYAIQARVQNRGGVTQTNVPVRLFYDGVQQGGDVLVTLAPNEVDTFDFAWTTPAAPDTGLLEVRSYLMGDVDPGNDFMNATVVIVGQPMAGFYDIGGGALHYATITAAVQDISLRGISSAVVFNVYPGTYNESFVIPAIPGATSDDGVGFVAVGGDGPVVVGAATVMRLNGADFITFDGIDFTANTSGRVIDLVGGADYNQIRNAVITGNDPSSNTTYGIDISGGGNDFNTIANVTISNVYYGVRFYGASTNTDWGNTLVSSALYDVRYGAYLYYQTEAEVYQNDIQPGWAGASTEITGIYCSTLSSGQWARISGNRVHNLRSSAICNGIYVSPGSGNTAYVENNFVYDFQGPSGTAVLYGLRTATGNSEWSFNSILIGDVPTTGNIYGFYITGTSTSATLTNNVIVVNEPVEACWALYVSGGAITSNYNDLYSAGPGALFNVGREASVDYATLAAWQATGHDVNSVSGDPGFVSSTDLHIAPTFGLLNGAGTTLPLVDTDIDGDLRGSPPDIGADEYEFSALAHDYGVNGFVGLNPTYVTGVPAVIQATVQNYGTAAETNVPVRLYYNGTQQDEVLVSLAGGATATVDLDWTPPITNYEAGVLEVQAYCPGDAFAGNDSISAPVTVVGPPLSGMYDLGGGAMDYATFTDAVQALALRGIDGEVVFDCYPGTYGENLTLTAVTGANFTDRVMFQAHATGPGNEVALTATGGAQVVAFNGADFITFDGINVNATASCDVGVLLDNGATYVTLRNLTVTSNDSTTTATRGIKVTFEGNDYCLIDNVTVSGAFYGIRSEGGSGQTVGWEVRNCSISGASYCVYLDDVHNARVHDCDLQPHGYASTSAYGVYCATLSADDTVYVYNNRIHNLRHTSTTAFATVAGVTVGVGSTAYAYVYNNFVYDWQTNGPDIQGIRVSTGHGYVYHNSIRMNEVSAAGDFAGVYVSSGIATVLNNAIMVEDVSDTCYAIWRAGGTLVASNYNAFHGTGPWFVTGRDGTIEYQDLTAWQTLGYDANSVAGFPGFVSATDLHIDPNYTLLSGAATPLPEVTHDIDGEPRSASAPDIGADEFVSAPDPVSNLTISADFTVGDVILRWNASPTAASYKIYVGTVAGFEPEDGTLVGHTGALTFTHVGGLSSGQRVFYVVLASTDAPPTVR